MLPFTTSFKLDRIHEFESMISVPDKGYCILTDTTIRLRYFFEKKISTIDLLSPEAVAVFLEKHGIISYYTLSKNGLVNMYHYNLLTITGSKGEPIQYKRPILFRWEDIYINQLQVLTWAAYHEFELAGNQLQQYAAKVIKISKRYDKAKAA